MPIQNKGTNKSLDFGCGMSPRNVFQARHLVGIDTLELRENEFCVNAQLFEYFKIDRGVSLPFESCEFDAVTAFDVLEHLSREPTQFPNEFILVMNEIVRVLKPGGLFLAVTPAFPSKAAFQDPTHTNIISSETIKYFEGDSAWAKELGYGFHGTLDLLSQFWLLPTSPLLMDSSIQRINQRGIGELLRTFRSFASSLRNPTHLVWLMEKSS